MKITILTVCPDFFDSFLSSHEVRRAETRSGARVQVVDIRDFADGSFRRVDHSPYGGGPGMVLRCEPVIRAVEFLLRRKEDAEKAAPEDLKEKDESLRSHIVMFTPAGRHYTQAKAREYAARLEKGEHLILLCGHYEGIDARVSAYIREELPCSFEELSVGDYILTGGELPAMTVTDSVLRLLPGNLKEGSAEEESFANGLLEYPQYTRPAEFRGRRVPEVLLSGNHEAVRRWREEESRRVTAERRQGSLPTFDVENAL